MAPAAEAWVPLAEIARPHGVRGELRLRLFNRDSDLLLELDEVLIRFADGRELELSVDGARRANEAILMRFGSVDDRTRAEQLRGALVCAKRSDFPLLEAGEFYVCDVEGARVLLQTPDGSERDIGRVRALRSYPTVEVLVVETTDGGRPWEVPLVSDVVRTVDVSAGLVILATMAGVERG